MATPGKLISHINLGYVNLQSVEHFILDEADRMLDIGFYDDIMLVVAHLPENRQTLMFSATMAPKIRTLARQILHDPVEISTAIAKPPEGVLQAVYLVHDEQKIPLITSLISDKPEYESILIFCSTKKRVSEIAHTLRRKGEIVNNISSDLEQKAREEVLNRFKARKIRILVATDVLSRGIDIKDINLIINFDVPQDAEDYVHRVGRTARADKTGVAITLVNKTDMFRFHRIEELIETSIIKLKVPTQIGDSPEWNPNMPKARKQGYKKLRIQRGNKKSAKHRKRK